MCHRLDAMGTARRAVKSALPCAEQPLSKEWLLALSLVEGG